MYASKYARGYTLETVNDVSKHDTRWYSDVPDVDTAYVLSEDGNELVIFAVNRDTEEKITLETKLLDFEGFVDNANGKTENLNIEIYFLHTFISDSTSLNK